MPGKRVAGELTLADIEAGIAAAGDLPFSLPDRFHADIRAYFDLLVKWQKVQNLVSRETIDSFPVRHLADSLQIIGHLDLGCSRVMDIGSGGGFPAIPLAIACREREIEFVLVEANRRKAAFLRTVGRELGLSLKVHDRRMEQLHDSNTESIDVFTSRATASLERLFEWSWHLWADSSRALFHKGRDFNVEISRARRNWLFDVIILSSSTGSGGVILSISGLRRRGQFCSG